MKSEIIMKYIIIIKKLLLILNSSSSIVFTPRRSWLRKAEFRLVQCWLLCDFLVLRCGLSLIIKIVVCWELLRVPMLRNHWGLLLLHLLGKHPVRHHICIGKEIKVGFGKFGRLEIWWFSIKGSFNLHFFRGSVK